MRNRFDNRFKKFKFINKIREKWRDIHTVMFFFVFCFLIIIWKLFSYTVFNYQFYTALADKQQIWTFSVPVNRWIIYSSIERSNNVLEKSSFLATSINLYDLAIDPKVDWDKKKLWEFLIDLIYDEICLNKTSEKCKNNLLKFLRVLDLEDFQNTQEYVKKAISDRIIPKIEQSKVTSVLLWSDFSDSQISNLKKLKIRGFYFRDNVIYVNPEEYTQTKENLELISNILIIDKEKLKNLTRKRDLRYVPILNRISVNSSEKIKDLIKEEKDAIKKSILAPEKSIQWYFILDINPSRYYPEWDVASQVIWFVDSEWVWRYWIEWYFNGILKGNNWKIVARKDTKWRIVDTISLENEDLIWEWVKIVTTIDRNIQKKVESILKEWVEKYRANKWTVVVTEPKTWRVLAMANYPTYDLNNYSDVYELEKVTKSKYPNPSNDLLWYPVFVVDNENWKKFFYDNKEIFLREASLEELWNPALVKYKYKNGFWAWVYKNDAISSLYEPGSIMKWITVAIWIDTWEINLKSKYEDKWSVKIDNFEIKNESSKCLWYNTFWHALNFSCNVWMIRIFQRVWRALASEYFELFGFSEATGIDLEWELYSPMTAWEKWPLANLFTKSYWLWIVVTPLQMAVAYNALANWWIYIKPKIIEKIIYPNGTEIEYKTEEKRRILKEETSNIMKNLLKDWVERWLAEKWWVPGYSVAWKTWTAQILFRWKYQSGPGWTNASYAWFWPVEDPKFVIIVKLERPRSNVYGSQTSWEMFNKIASYLFEYYWIPKSKK